MYPTLEGTLLSCATPLSRNSWGRGKYGLMLCSSTQRNYDSFSFHYPSLIFSDYLYLYNKTPWTCWLKSFALTYFAHGFAIWAGLCRTGSSLLHTVSACVTQLGCRIYHKWLTNMAEKLVLLPWSSTGSTVRGPGLLGSEILQLEAASIFQSSTTSFGHIWWSKKSQILPTFKGRDIELYLSLGEMSKKWATFTLPYSLIYSQVPKTEI